MQKFLGSVVTVLCLLSSINAMERHTDLHRAIKERDLSKVYTNIEYADNDSDFFVSLDSSDNFWLLLATFNSECNGRWYDDNPTYRLLRNMHIVFGYDSPEEFYQKHNETAERTATTYGEFIELLINIDMHAVIDCAVTYGLEEIMRIVINVLGQNEELAQKCIRKAIESGYTKKVTILLDKFITSMMLAKGQKTEHVWDFIRQEFLFAADLLRKNPDYGPILDSFLRNDLIESHLSMSDLYYAHNSYAYYNSTDNIERKLFVKSLINARIYDDNYGAWVFWS